MKTSEVAQTKYTTIQKVALGTVGTSIGLFVLLVVIAMFAPSEDTPQTSSTSTQNFIEQENLLNLINSNFEDQKRFLVRIKENKGNSILVSLYYANAAIAIAAKKDTVDMLTIIVREAAKSNPDFKNKMPILITNAYIFSKGVTGGESNISVGTATYDSLSDRVNFKFAEEYEQLLKN